MQFFIVSSFVCSSFFRFGTAVFTNVSSPSFVCSRSHSFICSIKHAISPWIFCEFLDKAWYLIDKPYIQQKNSHGRNIIRGRHFVFFFRFALPTFAARQAGIEEK
jgi:hypothetical protein